MPRRRRRCGVQPSLAGPGLEGEMRYEERIFGAESIERGYRSALYEREEGGVVQARLTWRGGRGAVSRSGRGPSFRFNASKGGR